MLSQKTISLNAVPKPFRIRCVSFLHQKTQVNQITHEARSNDSAAYIITNKTSSSHQMLFLLNACPPAS